MMKAALTGAAALMIGVIATVLYFESQLPKIESIEDYRPKTGTKIYSDDGHLVAHLAVERRTVVPIEQIPEHVKRAFMAAEDANFYQHEGLDYFGILRAFLKNLRPGAHRQGASTITQQTVKTLILGPERSYSRKIREALLSRQLEQLLTKDEILHLYLNQIYFGIGNHGFSVYGVEEASQAFFGKSVVQIDAGEAALLAGVPKNPSRYTILANPNAARQRQRYVLSQMVQQSWLTSEEEAAALERPLGKPLPPPRYLGKAPHYVEYIRRQLLEEFSEQQIYEEGLTVYAGVNARMQWAAHQAVQRGLEELTKRQGFPGAPQRIEVDQLALAKSICHQQLNQRLERRRAHPDPAYAEEEVVWDLHRLTSKLLSQKRYKRCRPTLRALKPGLRVRGLVDKVNPVANEVVVDLGTTTGSLSLRSLHWARPFSPASSTPSPRSVSTLLRPGDLIDVQVKAVAPAKDNDTPGVISLELIPSPRLQGALVAIDPHSRLIRAIVGGYSLSQTGFLRATQALRQPGSAFKPMVYATGIQETAITPASLCADSPVVIRDPWTGKAWKPENYEDGRYDGNITYRNALSRSKNTCSVRLVEKVTPEKVIATARAMGIHSRQPNNLTIALGTGDVTPLELTNAYASIASGGLYASPLAIRKIVGADGTILKEQRIEPTTAIAPATAFVVAHMMTSVVQEGTAIRARQLDRPLAGKTGTTNQSRNAWFAGFSPELVSVVWVGFDDNQSMGRLTGSSAALPIWINFMGPALKEAPKNQFVPPPEVVFRRVDRDTGAPTDDIGSIEEVFVVGTEPDEATEVLPSLFIEDE